MTVDQNKRVIINTIILYGRLIISAILVLLTTRTLLKNLGDIDFGIYNLISGVIILLAFLNTALSTSTQRYLSIYQGKDDIHLQVKVFNTSVALHLIISTIIFILGAVFKSYIFNYFVNIPNHKIEVAKDLFDYILISIFFIINTVPWNGALIAHENMFAVSIISIVDILFKLCLSYLIEFSYVDRLKLYGIGIATISCLTFLSTLFYCLKNYKESQSLRSITFEKKLTLELLSFTSWNLFGALCVVGRTQGIAIVLNIFQGVAIIASYGLATQFSGQLNVVSSTIIRAINPQIMKREGMGDTKGMLNLSMLASKYCFLAFSIIAIPIIFEMPKILLIWLEKVPAYSIELSQLMIIALLTNQLTIGLQSAIQATGKIRMYQSVIGSLTLMNIPMAYFLLSKDFDPSNIVLQFIIIELLACCLRVFFLKKIASLSISEYARRVIVRQLIPLSGNILICYLIVHFLNSSLRIIYTFGFSSIITLALIYIFSFESNEKSVLKSYVDKFRRKFIII